MKYCEECAFNDECVEDCDEPHIPIFLPEAKIGKMVREAEEKK